MNFIYGCNRNNKFSTVYAVKNRENYLLGDYLGKFYTSENDIYMYNIKHVEDNLPVKIELTNIDIKSNKISSDEYTFKNIGNVLDFDFNEKDIYFLTLDSLYKTSLNSNDDIKSVISLENHLFKKVIFSNGYIFLISENKVELYKANDNEAKYICSFKLANVENAILEDNNCYFLIRENYNSKLLQYDASEPDYPKYAKTYRKYIHNIQHYNDSLYFLMDYKIFKCSFTENNDNKDNKDEEVVNLISEYGYEQSKEKHTMWGSFYIINDNKYVISYVKGNKAYVDIITLHKIKKEYISIMLNYSMQTDILTDGMFENQNPLFTVEKIVFGNNDLYRDKLNTMIMSGNSPDIFSLDQYMMPYYANKNMLLPLNELFSEETHYMPILKTAEINGDIYGYPKVACIDGILINKNVLEQEWDILSGKTISIYDLLNEFKKPILKDNNKILPNVYWYWFFMQYSMQECHNLIDEKSGYININTNEFKEFLKNLKKIYDSEIIDKNIIHDNSLINNAEKVLLYPYTFYTMHHFNTLKEEYMFLPLMSQNNEKNKKYGINYVEALVISSNSRKQKVAKKYIEVFDSIQNVQNIINKANVELYMNEVNFNDDEKELVRNILNESYPYPSHVFHPDYQRIFEKNIEEYLNNNIPLDKAIDEITKQIKFITFE